MARFGLYYFEDNCGRSSISVAEWVITNYGLYSNRFHSGNDYPSARYDSSIIPNPDYSGIPKPQNHFQDPNWKQALDGAGA